MRTSVAHFIWRNRPFCFGKVHPFYVLQNGCQNGNCHFVKLPLVLNLCMSAGRFPLEGIPPPDDKVRPISPDVLDIY